MKEETTLLDYYFSALEQFLDDPTINFKHLEEDWRRLYKFAWADFIRFLDGWSPGHWKSNQYTREIASSCISEIEEIVTDGFVRATQKVQEFISQVDRDKLLITSKGMSSVASDIVTDIDLKAQKIILDTLNNLFTRFDLGLLAEENEDDQSRLIKHSFVAVDPLDGTKFFCRK